MIENYRFDNNISNIHSNYYKVNLTNILFKLIKNAVGISRHISLIQKCLLN